MHYAINTAKVKDEVLVFLGASYFRALGRGQVYGLSARGLAINTAETSGEEFPRFVEFWIARPAPAAQEFTIYALLDSPRLAGAYRFILKPGAETSVAVNARLYAREAVAKLSIAPLSSMYSFGENQHPDHEDYRPEVHDSHGLSVSAGNGLWFWRPLVNPKRLLVTSFATSNPGGFGLQQRDRNFSNYEELSTRYDRRPSVWVEPRGVWGRGAVHLVELPTADETSDNIVAYWNPESPPQPGQELLYAYRLWWGSRLPHEPPLAQVVATRTGIGGVVGRKRDHFSWRFVIDFSGGTLPTLGAAAGIEPVITASRGTVEIPSLRPLAALPGYRAIFDLRPDDESREPINLRLFLRLDGQALSETWHYQWTPPSAAERAALL